jgi:hypothetical protein
MVVDCAGRGSLLTKPCAGCYHLNPKNEGSPAAGSTFGLCLPLNRIEVASGNNSKVIHDVGIRVEVIVFALVTDRGKVVQDAYANLGKAHIVPKLLPLLYSEGLYRFALNEHFVFGKEVDIVLMLDCVSMIADGEIILSFELYVLLLKGNLQRILIDVFVKIGSQIAVHSLAASVQVIA